MTDDDLHAARERIAARIPGFVMPAAYGVARKDTGGLTFGHLNPPGAVRPLPAVVLASVCGYAARTAVFPLSRAQFADAVERLTPAEAATHMGHPNLWSWRELLAGGDGASTFLAFFLSGAGDPPVDEDDAAFRARLTP